MRIFLELIEFVFAVACLTFVVIRVWRIITNRNKRMERREENAQKLLAGAKSDRKVLDIKNAAKNLDQGETK